MSAESDDDHSDVGDNIDSDVDDETVEQIVSAVVDQVSDQDNARGGEEIVNQVIAEMKSEFPELNIRSKHLDDVLSKFRAKKLATVESKSQYRRKLDYIAEYFEQEVVADKTDELTSEDIEEFNDWRQYQSLDRDDPLSDVTLRDDVYLFREFVSYLTRHKLVPLRFLHVIEIPSVDYESGEGVDEKMLDPELAEASLSYLRRYHWASRDHIVMEILCTCGPRRGGVVGLDVEDYLSEESLLNFEHSDETPLKQNESSERKAKLSDEAADAIEDYIADVREDFVDENGRRPLLTTSHGRISLSTVKKIAYRWSRPCEVGWDCPHDRDPSDCEAAQNNNKAYSCPSSRAPHHARGGYITDRKNAGISAEAIEYQCNVSPEVQDLHYDLPDDSDERERYEHEFEEASDDSGYG